MSLLLDALKEAEARKRATPAAAPSTVEAAFATDGALALAEEVVAEPDPVVPAASPGATAAVENPADALLRARAARATAAPPPASAGGGAAAATVGGRRNRLAWLIGAAGLLILLLGAAALYQAFDREPEPIAAPPPIAAPDDATAAASLPPSREVVLAPEAPRAASRAPVRSGAAAAPRSSARPASPPRPRSSRATASVAPASLTIERGGSPLSAAWTALQAGDLDRARELYLRVQAAEPGQVDAELGLAVIAQARGDDRAALRGYRKVLESVPDHPRAWAGLAELAGDGEVEAMESRLRGLLATQPSAALHFALGNALARQQRWSDAQTEYFAAASLAPGAADYAYNLAISLDRIGKGAAAATWYARALELAGQGRAARFDVAAARERLEQLQASQP